MHITFGQEMPMQSPRLSTRERSMDGGNAPSWSSSQPSRGPVTLDPRGSEEIGGYAQDRIAAAGLCIKNLFGTSFFKPGAILPSERLLAEVLSYQIESVEAALKNLEAQGWIERSENGARRTVRIPVVRKTCDENLSHVLACNAIIRDQEYLDR